MGDRTTRATCEDAAAMTNNLRPGVGGFTPPTLIFRDEEQYVTFAVTRNPQRTPVETLLEGSAVRKENLRTYRRMAAHLIGTGFRVEPVAVTEGDATGEARDFGAGDGQVWRWRVTAVNAPSHHLTIEASVLFPVKENGISTNKLQPVLSHEYDIPVRVTFTQRVSDALTASGTWLQDGQNWLKIFAGFLVALGAAWVALRNLKPKRREEPAEV
jgi:hypothetical protein